MLSEQQQRIMGYFIEEAKDHLNTIEQGLLNLQATIADPEMASEVFRAAHSVKGGAAMLGLDSIQHASHRLEDYFKVLKECPLQVDQKLETLLLRVFDSLQELLEQLQGPFGLTEDKAAAVMAEAEPVFTQLNQHLSNLVRQSGATPPDDVQLLPSTAAASAETTAAAFGREVPARLRDMLAQFKQADSATTREQLQEICRSLGRLGERFSLTQWSELIALAQQAIAHTDNSYRALAPVLIKDIKQAYELILGGRSIAIQPSADLQRLVPVSAEPDLFDLLTPDEAALSAPLFDFEPLPEFSEALPVDEEATADWFAAAAEDSVNGAADVSDFDSLTAPQSGPEVGLAELNSLADLFEGELPDLGLSWQEEVISDENGTAESLDLDSSNDFSDLLFDQSEATTIPTDDEDLSGLLNGAAEDSETALEDLSFDLFAEPAIEENSDFDLSGLAFTDAIAPVEPPPSEALGDLNGLFADVVEAPSSSDSAALDDLFGADAALFALEPDEPSFGDAFALNLDADSPESTEAAIDLDDPFALPAADLDEADLAAMLSEESDIESAQSTDAAWQDTEVTGDLWDSTAGDLSLDAIALEDAIVLDEVILDDPLTSPELSETASAETAPAADLALNDLLLDFDSPAEAGSEESAALPSPMGVPDELLDLSDLASENALELGSLDDFALPDSTISDPFGQGDLDDLFAAPPDLAIEPEAIELSLDEVLLGDSLNDTSLEDANLDALFGSDSEAAIAEDAALADLLAPVELAPAEADFDFLLEAPSDAPSAIELDSLLEPATPAEADEFDFLLEPLESESIEANLFDLTEDASTADEPLRFEPSASIEADLFDLTTENGVMPDADDLQPASSAESQLSDADFFGLTGEETASDEFDLLLEQPESDSIATDDLFNSTSEDSAASIDADDLFGLTSEDDASIAPDDLFNFVAEDESEIATDDLLNLTVETEAEAEVATDDLFSLTADDLETPLLDQSEADLNTDELLELDRELLVSIDADTPLENSLSAFDLDATDADAEPLTFDDIDTNIGERWQIEADAQAEQGQNQAEQDLDLLNFDAESIDLAALPEPQTDRMTSAELAFDLDAIETGTASAEDLFDLSPADEDSVFDLDAIDVAEEDSVFNLDAIDAAEVEPFDLDAALMEDAINAADPDASSASLDDLDSLFVLDETAPAESIDTDEDALDLLLAADDESIAMDSFTMPPVASSELDDLDALLMAAEAEPANETAAAENLAIAPDDFEAAFNSDLAALPTDDDLNDLDSLLTVLPAEDVDFDALLGSDMGEAAAIDAAFPAEAASESSDDFIDLEALLGDASEDAASNVAADGAADGAVDDFADLAALLEPEAEPAIISGFAIEDDASGFTVENDEEFASLDALLSAEPAASTSEFDDLEKLLKNADQTLGGSPSEQGVRRPSLMPKKRSPGVLKDQNMRVSVKNLDNLNNLVGELVVNRNSLEQTQERVRQFLDNLVYQVQQLSDVGQRMRDLYERSLLESSLLSSRRSYQLSSQGAPPAPASHSTGLSFDALEMDRFTGFHTLSQEMIELIVRVRESASDIDRMVDESDQITRMFRQVTTQLQEGLTRSRMVPFDQTAARMPRAVRDISLKCGKQAELVVEGKETLIDKMILEQLYDPMTHLVNNAITHGIETPADRQAAGKPPTGRITIRAFHQGNQTVISVTDDGAGIDPEAVKRKAIEKNLITPAEAREMTRLDVYDLLFLHGFSTRDRADDFAGRGVGMDVVRTSLNEVRGTVNIDSTIGRGTTFTIRLPLTLSISKALCCISNRARIAFPMDGVEDMFDVPREQVQTDSEGRACIQWRDTLLPFQPLAELLRYSRNLGRGSVYGGNQDEDIVSVVVLRSNAGSFLALQVDQVLGEQEIVIKQLEGPVPKPVGVAGATVLGDGHIMPIADVLELIDLSQGLIRREPGSSLWEKADGQVPIEPPVIKNDPTVLIVDDSITVRELLSMTFNKVGYRVEQARDGQEAWEKLRSGLPCDLVFCDIEMPRMDGLELLSRIQKDPNLNHLPIAMLTSRGADRHRQMAVQLGAKGYFTKPYLEESLLDAAGRMLKGEVLVS